MEAVIAVPSNSGEGSYEVQVNERENSVQIICNCQAGQFGRLCKHKLRVIRVALGLQEGTGLVGDIRGISKAINPSRLPLLVQQLDESEQALEDARVRVARAKKILERHLIDGG